MLEAKGMAQVSMNLTDYSVTGISTVFEAIGKEAVALGTEVAESELVGLVPLDAVCDVAKGLLKIPNFSSNQVLERRIWG